MNRIYLNHDYYTDILTFNIAENRDVINGEIYISIDRVKDNSRTLNEYFSTELLRVIFHGALHLCGYNDETPPEIKKIRNKEDYYLKKYRS